MRGRELLRAVCRRSLARLTVPLAAAGLTLSASQPLFAQDIASPDLALHAQSTFVVQGTPGFPSPYSGDNSLTPHQARETFDATLYAGVRPWQGGEIWINPEIDQGFGLSNTLGVAGFPSAEAYKVGKSAPYFKLPRLFWRQTIGLGGGNDDQSGGANQFSGPVARNRLILTLGKFSVVDVFDTNAYAHDARGDFLNWAVVDAGAFDYAANAWGFTFGGTAEWVQGRWTLRAGLFDLSKVPNSPSLEIGFAQYQTLGEIEHRHRLGGRPGAIRVGAWLTRGRLALLRDLIAAHDATGVTPDLADHRAMNDHGGGYVNVEQEVSDTLGLFARASASDGVTETDDFTDIDRSLQLGGSLKGAAWGRAGDRAGLAGVVNAISRARQIFLDQGGLGPLVGDGRLPHPGHEWIAEGWYAARILPHVDLSLDYQFIANPGYNRDRGPAHVFALRLHGAV